MPARFQKPYDVFTTQESETEMTSPATSRPSPLDWSAGAYEATAAELEPVAERVVALAAPEPGERVLDIACGTGNAALLAARRGATAIGVDSAPRLIEVARSRAVADSPLGHASFMIGDAQDLPFEDAAFDLVLSVFGVIFAQDPQRALSEIVRVLRPGGRALVTAWLPDGAMSNVVGIAVGAVVAATGMAQPRFAWHDPGTLSDLVASCGASVSFKDGAVAFTDSSPESYFGAVQVAHPLHVSTRPLLEQAGTYDDVRERMLAALRDGNEDPDAFRITSRYRVARIQRTT